MTDPTTATAARLRALTSAFLVILSMALVLALTAVAYLALAASQQSMENGAVLNKIEGVNNRLVDCSVPGGKCFQESQDRTKQAVVGVNEGTLRVIVAALSCQEEGVTSQPALARCTVTRSNTKKTGMSDG